MKEILTLIKETIKEYHHNHSDAITAGIGGSFSTLFASLHFERLIYVILSAILGALFSLIVKDLYTFKLRKRIFSNHHKEIENEKTKP